MLLSSSSIYTNSLVTADECKTPLMILNYKQSKGGVGIFDETVAKFSCRRKTVSWALLFFYNMLHVAANNSYILMKKSDSFSKANKAFLKELTFHTATHGVEVRLDFSK